MRILVQMDQYMGYIVIILNATKVRIVVHIDQYIVYISTKRNAVVITIYNNDFTMNNIVTILLSTKDTHI